MTMRKDLHHPGTQLHVAMISQTYAPFTGGVASQVATLASTLHQQGIAVSVLTRHMPETPTFEYLAGIPVYRVASTGPRLIASLIFIWRLLRLLRHLQPDVIHAHELLLPTTVAVIAKWLLGIPVVVTVHSSGAALGEIARLRRAPLGALRLASLRRSVDRFVAISRVIDQEMAAAGIDQRQRIAIPNGIDMRHFAPLTLAEKNMLCQRLNLTGTPIIVYTGRLASEKRVQYLLEMWPEIRQHHPTANLLLVGDGPEAAALQAMAGEGVVFVGGVQDVAPYLQAADIFVLPSVAEGFSLSTLEALATGLPVVATAVGAIPEFVTNGQNGCIVPPDDFVALQSALLKLLAEPACWPYYGECGRSRVVQAYGLSTVTTQLQQLYFDLADQQFSKPIPLSRQMPTVVDDKTGT